MDTLVFSLVLFAAFTHASWNYFSKKVSGNFTVFWYGLFFVNSILLIYTTYFFITNGTGSIYWPPIIISAIVHGSYYFCILYTYSKEDISSIYPIARGTGVIGTALVSYFFLKETISPFAAYGISIVCLGILLISLSKIKNKGRSIKPYFFAVLTGVFIVMYAVTDKIGVQHMHPIVYISLVDLIATVALARAANKNGFSESIKIIKKYFKETLIIGIGSTGTYLIILFAMRFERASYIFSVRESSIVIASIMGFIFLKEKPTLFKIIGIASITAGLILIKLG
ncbi:MAG: DMT family transporter [Spirochaetaceae bacterium]|nr:DMT family transporter [Spirochaetaceae bacterium]